MRNLQASVLAALLGLSSFASAFKPADYVTNLPDCDRLSSDWFSGYLNVSPTKSLHYVFVGSLDDPQNDPVVVWFNGGPGCSSLLALFQEHGPFVIDDGEYSIKTNPQPWNVRANVLYIESPAGVGFSWANSTKDKNQNDMSVSQDAFLALQDWFTNFPEYLTNELYISGESYGGIYVPYLAWQIHQWNQRAAFKSSWQKYNLKGYIVGNGATNWDVDISPAYPEVVYNFHIINKELLDTFQKDGCHYYFNDVKTYNNSKECNDTWDKINSLASDLNWYDLFRRVYPDNGLLAGKPEGKVPLLKGSNRLQSVNINGEEKTYKAGMTMKEYTPWAEHISENMSHPLLGAYLTEYVNRPDVRQALHIPDSVQAWSQCSDDAQDYYHYQFEGSEWIYKILMQYGYKILFFSGDTDGAVPTLGTRRWISALQLPIKKPW